MHPRIDHACAVLLLGLQLGCAPPKATQTQAQSASGFAAANWPKLRSTSGHWVRSRDPTARATVLLFVRHDCPVANRYAPRIQAIYERFRTHGVTFFTIYLDGSEDEATIREHQAAYGLTIPALRDPRHQLVHRTNARVTPQAILVDRSGKIVYSGRIDDWVARLGKYRLETSRHDLIDAIEAVLAGTTIREPRTPAVGCYIPAPSP